MILNEQRLHQIFQLSILAKGVHALAECVGGVALWLVSNDAITRLARSITHLELIEDPRDFLATHLLTFAQNFSVETRHFYTFYLVSHGVVKLFLVAALLRNKLWAYPSSLVVMALFIVYQLYRFSYTHSWGLIALTVFDVIVIWLIWHEYKLVMRRRPAT